MIPESKDIVVGEEYHHAEGGLYRVTCLVHYKFPDGQWVPGVAYVSVGKDVGQFYVRTLANFRERFSEDTESVITQLREENERLRIELERASAQQGEG